MQIIEMAEEIGIHGACLTAIAKFMKVARTEDMDTLRVVLEEYNKSEPGEIGSHFEVDAVNAIATLMAEGSNLSFPPMPSLPGASPELRKALLSTYHEPVREFMAWVNAARTVYSKYPELVLAPKLPADLVKLAEQADVTVGLVLLETEFTDPDAMLKKAEERVMVWQERKEQGLSTGA
jgi:hypothetical protein